MNPEVTILLATYNSEKFLAEQLNSILDQSYSNWKLIIQDGGSTDSTIDIVKKYLEENSEKVCLIRSKERLNACQNFSKLLKHSKTEFTMFCDHDDVWLPNKIELTLTRIKKEENNQKVPICVFTDLSVVDEELKLISKSFFSFSNIDPHRLKLNYQLLQNVPTGCTMMMNRALLNLIPEIPNGAVMHDHWVSLTSICFGKLLYLNVPTILYRQHQNNVFGIKAYGIRFFISKLTIGIKKSVERFKQNTNQARAFLNVYTDELNDKHKATLKAFISIPDQNYFRKLHTIKKFSLFKSGMLRNIGMIFLFMFFK